MFWLLLQGVKQYFFKKIHDETELPDWENSSPTNLKEFVIVKSLSIIFENGNVLEL